MPVTDDPNDPRLSFGVDAEPTGLADAYLVLSEAERAKGYVRPLRQSYIHTKCGTVTTMSVAIAETYARDPKFYGATYCCFCRMHPSVSEFVWSDPVGHPTTEVVGS